MKVRDKVLALCVVCLACVFGIAAPGLGQERGGKETIAAPAKIFRVTEGFQGPLSVKAKSGKVATWKVSVHTWSIDGELGRQTIRTSDFTLFHLRGGKLKIFTDGKEELKSADAYWTSPAGATVTL